MSRPKKVRPKKDTVHILHKEDFTDYANDCVGVWAALIEHLPKWTEAVEVRVLSAEER